MNEPRTKFTCVVNGGQVVPPTFGPHHGKFQSCQSMTGEQLEKQLDAQYRKIRLPIDSDMFTALH